MTAAGVLNVNSGKKFLQKCMDDATAFPLHIRFSAMMALPRLRGHFDFENVLFATSILENVRYGIAPEPSEQDVRQALEQASALQFVDAFPDKLHTRVGSRGLALSGGQRQRVAIARAMVRKPNILILDEATSALDPVNEKIVQAALDKLVKSTGACTLTIAHRLTTVKDCDKILVFSDGKLVEEGTHEDLLDIAIQREDPRGHDKEGRLVSGIYRTQWTNMMGVDPSKEKEAKTEDRSEAANELERARTEIKSLRAQLLLAQQQLREADTQVTTVPRSCKGLIEKEKEHISQSRDDLPSLLRNRFNESSRTPADGSISFEFDALGSVPSPLLLNRFATAAW